MKAIVVMIVIAGICFGQYIEYGLQQVSTTKPFCGG